MGDSRPPGTPDNGQQIAASANRTDSPTPAALFGDRYRIERVIGEGAFGRVYLALDSRLRRNVAVKELLASRHTTDRDTYERYLERFQREARATGMIQQPNVVTVYDLHVDTDGNHYLVMEYVDGTNLRDLLAQVGTLPVERAVTIAREMARALEAVHEQEIVHRDVKPANIMLTRRGTAKLMDFGIAQVGNESHRTQLGGGHPGTPIYMSPEQSSGYGYIDGRSDLYALGLVLYEMLVGEPYARKRRLIAAARPDLSPQLTAIVEKLMARDPDARYQSATDVLRDLDGLGVLTDPAASETYPLPNAGAPRVDTAPSVGWQTGVPGAAPVPGVPSAYGGALSQPPAGPPSSAGTSPYATGVPPAAATGAGGFAPPPAYATTAPYTLPPSAPPPRRGNRGLLFGIGGAAVAIVAVLAVIFIATSRNDSPKTATATVRSTVVAAASPTAQPTPAASSTPRPTASPTVGPTATATVREATPSPAPAANLTTFTDPKSLVRLQYPSGWKATKVQDDPANFLELDGPDNVFFWVYIYDPQQGTIADEINAIRTNQDNSTDFTYTNRAVTDITIAGEPAKSMTYSFASNKDASSKGPGQWWVVNHGGKQFTFRANYAGSHQPEINAMIASVAFTTGGPSAQVTTWTDPKGLVKLQYPNGWSVTKDTAVDTNVLELDGPDGTYFFLDIYDPQSGATVAAQIQDILDVHTKSTKFTYQDGAVSDTKIGGEAAKTFTFTYTEKNKANAQPFSGQIWDVNHGGKEYLITGNANATHRAEINAIIASIVFLK